MIKNIGRNFSSHLHPSHIREILIQQGIRWNPNNVNSEGWVKIKSPIRIDQNYTFSINIDHGGYYDSSTHEKGDIVNLISKRNGWPISRTIQFLAKNCNINYQTKTGRYF